MQVSVETGEGLERRLRVELPSEQITTEAEKRLQQLSRSARLPGFRPGKVPMKLLRKRYWHQVLEEVFGDLVQSSFGEAVTQESLHPVGRPQIEPEIDPEQGQYAYTAIFEVLPEIELNSLDGKSLKRPVSEVTDADVEAMIQRLREQHKTWSPVERAAQEGDQLTVTFAGTIDGEAFEGGSGSGMTVEIGANRLIPGFEEGLVGAAPGEQRVLDLSFPESYQNEELAGKPVRFEVTVDEIAEPVLAELDAGFVKRFGVEDGDVERFQADVRANMERELKQRLEARIKEQVMDLLLETNPVDVPHALVHDEIHSMKDEMQQSLGTSGKMELPDSLFEEAARRRVALGLIVGEVVKHNEIKADADQVRKTLEEMASTYEQPQDVIDYYYGDRSRLASVEALVLESQVVDFVMGQVSVEDESLSFDDLVNPSSAAG